MSVAVKKLEGVESVIVSLEKGLVEIVLKPGNKLTIERVRRLLRDNGFTPKGTEVVLFGTVVEIEGRIGLSVRGTGVVYRLADYTAAEAVTEELATAVGRDVSLVGFVPASSKDSAEETPVLRVRSFSLQ